jgi:ABC-type multidrug transport system permease subunit
LQESASGYYQTWTFFIAKLICDVLPVRLVSSVIFTLLVYFLTGLQRSIGQYLVFFVTIFMASVFGSALCFLISATIPDFGTWNSLASFRCNAHVDHLVVASIVVVLIFVTMMVFSGFLVELASVSRWLSWIQWISAFRYSSDVLTVNEFRNIHFCLSNRTDICPMRGSELLDRKALDHETVWDMWKKFVILTMMAAILLLMALVQLIRLKKMK